MNISIQKLAKKFRREWIFKNLNWEFQNNETYAITGSNGSGKSTLLQIISGILAFNKGQIEYKFEGRKVEVDTLYKYLTLATPYLELVEEFTLIEAINFHLKFKNFEENIPIKDFILILGLQKSKNKPIKYFSSGMKQRLKLGFALHTDAPLLLLDEPTTNLDAQGIAWYKSEVEQKLNKKTIIICSNQKSEYEFCKSDNILDIMQYK